MEGKKYSQKCINHPENNSHFYCFDDKKFLCDRCFKEHKHHNIEVKSEIEKTIENYQICNSKKNIIEHLQKLKELFLSIKNEMDDKIQLINSTSLLFQNSSPTPAGIEISSLTFEEYEKISQYSKILNSIEDIVQKIKNFSNFNLKKEYTDFKIINKDVIVLQHSDVNCEEMGLNVMLSKQYGSYTLFEGSNNHFAIFNLTKPYFLSEILISVKQNFGCVLKNFTVSIKNKKDEWELVEKFICKDNLSEQEMQQFKIERETQFVRMDYLDAWSSHGGNYILIKRLAFKVAEI